MSTAAAIRGMWLLVCVAGLARAESLEDAWRMAAAGDPGLAAATSEVEAAKLEARAVRGQRWPMVVISGSFTQLRDAPAFSFGTPGLPAQLPEMFDRDNFAIGGISVSVPVYAGGRIASSIAAADAGHAARNAGMQQTEQDLKSGVAESYFAVLRAERTLAVSASNVASLLEYAGNVEAMFSREVVPRNDLLSAQVALANARQLELQAVNTLDFARAAYNRHLGQPLDRPFTLQPVAAAAPPGTPERSLAELEAIAQDNRPEIAMLEAQARGLKHSADAERSKLLPQINLTGSYQYLENQALDREEFALAGVGLSWSLFDGGQVRNRAGSFRQGQRALEQRLAALRATVALEVRQAWLNERNAKARVAVTREAVTQAEENLRIANQQYAAGLVNSTRVLEAEALRILSLSNLENAALDVVLAQVHVARASGQL